MPLAKCSVDNKLDLENEHDSERGGEHVIENEVLRQRLEEIVKKGNKASLQLVKF